MAQQAGIHESPWVPLSTSAANGGRRRFWTRTLADIAQYKPTRLEFTFQQPAEDWSDDWYELLVSHLYERARRFALDEFGYTVAAPRGRSASVWAKDFSAEFISLASQATRKDVNIGGWDTILLDGKDRAYLVLGVLSRVLDEYVFSELAFGDSEANKKLWNALDENHLEEEGKEFLFLSHFLSRKSRFRPGRDACSWSRSQLSLAR